MPRYKVTLMENEVKELKELIQKDGKGYRIKHAQILLKLDKKPENKNWTYERIQEAYNTTPKTIAGVAKRFVMEGMEAALGRKKQQNHYRKVTGEVDVYAATQTATARALNRTLAAYRTAPGIKKEPAKPNIRQAQFQISFSVVNSLYFIIY